MSVCLTINYFGVLGVPDLARIVFILEMDVGKFWCQIMSGFI